MDSDVDTERLTRLKYPVTRKPMAYVCFEGTCITVKNPEEIAEIVKPRKSQRQVVQTNVKTVQTLKKNLLFSIEGKRLNGYVLHVNNLSPGRFIEETNFELYLKTMSGEVSQNPVVKGKYFSGRGKFYKPWLEIYYNNLVRFQSTERVALSEKDLDEKMFKHLSNLLSPDSHIMVIYSSHEETRKGLERGIPAPATPIGHLLWKSGCTSFKDWYFAEGFWEGDIKLQGNKPLNEKTKRKDLLETYKELTEFLKKEKKKEKLFLDARKRAEDVLRHIAREEEDPQYEMGQ